VFSEVTSARRRVAHRGAFAVGSAVAQAILVVALVAAGGRPRETAAHAVEVKLLMTKLPGPPPPGLPPLRIAGKKRPNAKAPKPPRTVMSQPTLVRETVPAPDVRPVEVLPEVPPTEPVASAEPALGDGPAGAQGGVVGGVPGGDGSAPVREVPDPAPRVDFSESMAPPRLLDGPSLEYTPEALEHRVEGLMIVRCVVSVDGRVHGCRVVQGLPFMDAAVVAVLEGRRYAPATLNGTPLEVNYTFRIKLRLPR